MKYRALFFLLASLGLTSCSSAHKETPLVMGARVYAWNCVYCHQQDGRGVPGLQPALEGSTVVSGNPQFLIRVVLYGPAQVLPADRPRFTNLMPAYGSLSDEELAAVLSYIRQRYGKNASPIQPGEIAAERR